MGISQGIVGYRPGRRVDSAAASSSPLRSVFRFTELHHPQTSTHDDQQAYEYAVEDSTAEPAAYLFNSPPDCSQVFSRRAQSASERTFCEPAHDEVLQEAEHNHGLETNDLDK